MSANPASTPASPPPAPQRSNAGFALYVATIALIVSFAAIMAVAFKMRDEGGSSGNYVMHHGSAIHGTTTGGGTMMGGGGAASTSGSGGEEEVNLVVKSDEEHAKRGPEGTWHDAYLPADFNVSAGASVKVTVLNYDEGEHTFTSMPLGLNVKVGPGAPNHPSVTTFTFQAPAKAGNYLWLCMSPCDPWAMAHVGYMRGFVQVS